MSHPEGTAVDPGQKPGAHGAILLAAVKALGKRPGVVWVPTKFMRNELNQGVAAAEAKMPPDIVKGIKLLKGVEWAAIAAKIDDKPAAKLIMQMPDETTARLVAEWYPPSMKLFGKMMPPPADADDTGSQPFFVYMIPPLAKLQAASTASRFTLAADTPTFISLLDVFFVEPHRSTLRIALEPGHERLAALSLWIENYRLATAKWPGKLEDLQPLLHDEPAEQARLLKLLLTNAKSQEYPSIVYTAPTATKPLGDDETPPTMLAESKGGKPDPDGWQVDAQGTMSPIKKSEPAK